jgi:hypothetical protein
MIILCGNIYTRFVSEAIGEHTYIVSERTTTVKMMAFACSPGKIHDCSTIHTENFCFIKITID